MDGKGKKSRSTGKGLEKADILDDKKFDMDFLTFLRIEIGNSPKVARDMTYCLHNLLSRWPMDFPNANRLRQLALNVLDADFSKSYQRKALITIERYAKFLGIEGVKFKKPKQTQKEIQYLTQDEMSALVKAASTHRDYAIMYLFCKTGMRSTELLSLNVSDINFERGEIIIRHGKGDRSRIVDFDAQTDRVLRTYIGKLKISGNSPLFTSRNGHRLSYKALHTMIVNTGRKAGLSVHPHMLRHSFATAWISNDADIFHLQGILGHTDLSMTRRYFHACNESRKMAYLKGAPQF
jgi:integrase